MNITLAGTDAQNAAMRPFTDSASALLGDRIDPLTIMVKPRTEMPRYRASRPGDKPGDGHAEGYWRDGPHTILIADDVIGRDDLDETIGHELVHALFSDWLRRKAKRQLLPFLSPTPQNYSDTMVNGVDKGYPALPEECIAVWGSAALFGFAQPAYASLYKRTIAPTAYPTVKALLLGEEPVPPEPPADPCAPYKATIATLESSLATANAAKAAAEARALVLSSAGGYLLGDIDAAVTKYKERTAA